MKKILFLLPILFTFQVKGQVSKDAKTYSALITTVDLKDNLSIIASNAMEGRETGTRGQKMAAAFIAYQFEQQGLTGPVNGQYLQTFDLYGTTPPVVSLSSGATTLTSGEDYFYMGSSSTNGPIETTLLFAGNGDEIDLNQVDLKGKSVLIILEGSAMRSNTVVAALRKREAAEIFIVIESNDSFNRIASYLRDDDRLSLTKETTPGLFFLTASAAEKLYQTTLEKLNKAITEKKLAKVKPAKITYSVAQRPKIVKSENVLGYLEGTDKKDELVVVTAHYDHIGKKKSGEGDLINNGADDDGSGTVAVLALAKAFAAAKKEGHGPRRSMLFMTVTGEEKGLFGSDYYTQHPVFPLDKTVVDLNMDMIGRVDPDHKASPPYVYVVGSDKLSSELHALSESINKETTNLIFDYTYNDQNHPERIYYRSDHWNFAKNNIPIIFYFDGIHEDYHQVTDEIDKINFDLLTQRAQCVFFTAWDIANRDARLAVDKK